MSTPFTDPARWAAIDRLLDAALDRPIAERHAFVQQQAGNDRDLAEAVTRLLDASSAPSVLDETNEQVRDAMLREAVRDWEAAPPEAPTVPRYTIARELGRGGMGTVYLGTRNDGAFDQQVAIKVLRRGVDTDDVLARFRRERQILAGFDHPNIGRLLDGGATEDGRPYLVMEFVDGVPVTEWCEARPRNVRQTLSLFTTICSAVEYAHSRLVVHRDIKPSNILVDAAGTPKLLDFGIAKLLGDADGGAPHAGSSAPLLLTRTGLVYATPRYASPEQLRGDPISTSTDVYQLGVLLYELLTGAHPTGDAASTLETMRLATLAGTVPPPSSVRGSDGLRGDLDAIVLKALRPDASERYASVTALREDIDRHLRGEAVVARQGATWYRVRRTLWRNRAALALAGVAVAAASVYVVSLRRYATELEAERNRAELAAEQASQTTDFLVDLFRAPGDSRRARGDTLSARTLLTRGAERVRTELADQPAVRASLLAAIGTAADHLFLGNVVELLDAEIDALIEAYGREDPRVSNALRRQAGLFMGNRQFAFAAMRLNGALQLATASTPDSVRGRILSGLGNALVFSERADTASLVLADAVRVLSRDAVANRRALMDTRLALAAVERRRGNVELADTLLRGALAEAESDTTRAPILNNLASLRKLQERLDDAEEYYRLAVLAARASTDPSDQGRNMAANNYASLLMQRERYDAALGVLQEELATQRATFPADHWRVGAALGAVAQVLTAAGRPDEAIPYHEEQLGIYTRALGPGNGFTIRAEGDFASTLRALGRTQEAEVALQRAEAAARLLTVPQEREQILRRVRDQLAALYDATGDPARAARYRTLAENP